MLLAACKIICMPMKIPIRTDGDFCVLGESGN